MKKSLLTRLGAGALILTLVSTVLLSGTLAKYTSEVKGTSEAATVAKWAVAMKANGAAYDGTSAFSLGATSGKVNLVTNAATGTIAPGSVGSFNFEIDTTNSMVKVDYSIVMDLAGLTSDGKTVPIKFYSNSDYSTPLTVTDNKCTLVNKEKQEPGESGVQTVYWKWEASNVTGTGTEGAVTQDDIDKADVALGEAVATGSISVTLHAEQADV